MSKDRPELIAGAGDMSALNAALNAGADAVYFGTTEFNLRANAKSFELNQIRKAADLCHANGAKAYLTLNSVFYDSELDRLRRVLDVAKSSGIDSVICWDMAVVNAVRELGLGLHVSTQASVSNFEALKFYASLGARRVVLARELSLEMIRSLSERVKTEGIDVELEAFVHGAMCVSVSGRCFISEYLYGRSANKGDCLQPCRREWRISDTEDKGELIIEDGFVLSPSDICTIGFVDKLIDSGLASFKIEGRTRSPEYVSVAVASYREAIDAYYRGEYDDALKERLISDLRKVYNRGFSNGFYFGRPIADLSGDGGSLATEKKEYVGEVRHFYRKIMVAEMIIRHGALSVGDEILFIGNKTGVYSMKIDSMQSEHESIQKGEKGWKIAIKTEKIVRKHDKVFIIKKV